MTLHTGPIAEDASISFASCGIERLQKDETNAGARALTLLAEDRSLLRPAQARARAFASTRDSRHWCSTLGVAASAMLGLRRSHELCCTIVVERSQ